ncbi:hypothetical protein [Myxococcus xanthus]|uniref:Lipoprotein n=1 Tax=Myxococcus xanthus TaxID=34 RepID=A0A7Y4IJS6_MYXXA|nr:hypothetical protein [Myxococcus xanthus]NOJ87651.1 hypothetical protein [Myxococcus xanthus]
MTTRVNPGTTAAVRRALCGAFAAIAVGLFGCNDLEVCGSTASAITRDGGEPYRCVTAEDCPRTSRVNVCVTDVSPVEVCVRCQDTKCVTVTPEACD